MENGNNFGKLLGIELVKQQETTALARLEIKESHLANSGIPSQGVVLALASVTMECLSPFNKGEGETVEQEVNYVHAIKLGDVLEAQGSVMGSVKSTGLYQVAISNQTGEVVFWLKGTYKK